MSLFSRLFGMFFTSGAKNNQALAVAIEQAKKGEPSKALVIYDELLKKPSIDETTRASALFNRALAHSSLKNDVQALVDLKQLLALPNLPENVQTAARSQLARVSKRAK